MAKRGAWNGSPTKRGNWGTWAQIKYVKENPYLGDPDEYLPVSEVSVKKAKTADYVESVVVEKAADDVELVKKACCLLDKRVKHRVFGIGVVENVDGTMLSIRFDVVGTKPFRYPAAFDSGFLSLI